MEGLVTAYSGTSLTINVSKIGGSGTHADWNINVSGEPGSGDLLSTNNLADVANPALARANLGVFQAAQCAPQGRLTLASGVPVMKASQAAATIVYYTPYAGSIVPIYDGTTMLPFSISELSQATTDATKSPAAVAASKMYDIFVWNDGGTIRATRGPAWANDATRGYTLTYVNGIALNTSAITNGPAALRGTYVGTIRSNAASTIDYIFGSSGSGGVAAFFGVWNAYNRVSTPTTVIDTAAAYTYSSATVRQAHGASGTGNQISFVLGLAEDGVFFSYTARTATAAVLQSGAFWGVGFNVNNAFSITPSQVQTSAAAIINGAASNAGVWDAPVGLNVLYAVEQGDSTTTCTFNFKGTNALMATVFN
jgi:hypothetical protein